MLQHLYPLINHVDEIKQKVFHDAISGDSVAFQAVLDIIQEEGRQVNPFEVGKAYYIETLTLYYVGEVVEAYPTWVRLKNASWIHWTGRKSVLFKHKKFAKELFENTESKPRTEYIGTCNISLAGVNVWEEWPIENIPKESI